MSAILADDPTAAAVLSTVPCFPVPPSGRSPAIDGLREARAGHGLAIGADGVMLILRRPWLELDVPVTDAVSAYLPYGSIGRSRAYLRCGLIPHALLVEVLAHFEAALPNEAAAFIIWNELSREFAVRFPAIDEATPSRLVYRTPVLPADWHVICDIHSHGRMGAFFSATDDADDAHSTKLSLVFGQIDHPDGATVESRLCAGGMFLPFTHGPFAGDEDAA